VRRTNRRNDPVSSDFPLDSNSVIEASVVKPMGTKVKKQEPATSRASGEQVSSDMRPSEHTTRRGCELYVGV